MRGFLFAIFLASASSLSAQDSLYWSDTYRFADATIYTYTQPVRWKQKQWLTFGGVLAGTAALTFLDRPIRELFLENSGSLPQFIEDTGYHYGKPYSAFAFTGGFYLVGVILNDRWAKDTGLNLGATLLTSGLLQTVLKGVVGRARPGTEAGPYAFQSPSKGDAGYHSFPSGHSAVAFGITMVLARRIESTPLRILFYTLAASTTLSRLHTDDHWISDMAFGAALAWACDKAVNRRLVRNGRPLNQFSKINWSLSPTSNWVGVTGRF